MNTEKVEILEHGTSYGNPGDIVDVTPEMAGHLCSIRQRHDVYGSVSFRLARPLAEAQAAVEAEKTPDISEMTQAELNARGLKNVVASPDDVGPVNKIAAEKAKKGKKGKDADKESA